MTDRVWERIQFIYLGLMTLDRDIMIAGYGSSQGLDMVIRDNSISVLMNKCMGAIGFYCKDQGDKVR